MPDSYGARSYGARPVLSGRPVLHRSLDVQGSAELIPAELGATTNETYQDADGQHVWSLKRFSGGQPTDTSTDNNPEEVEQVRK
ncbi:hypothetical protein J2Y66_002562 [Paenarthrobacter nitroguajacolicus]|uniref:hypothetical protein n=1 Tax=Paenarthrobacter nitroguajacolicus TaxID=211146 RepID=UPI00285BD0F3|nr:hypothetical protein [Paenarthrobacter nitroguajacolicus]MDR6988064.1 hypothetical protein [Paenarthrobacter nitroguajacolicus]